VPQEFAHKFLQRRVTAERVEKIANGRMGHGGLGALLLYEEMGGRQETGEKRQERRDRREEQ
jgi:hypothetical protein